MASVSENTVHPQPTQRRGLQYQFTPKHHGGDPSAARWVPEISFEEEFSICDRADLLDLTDSSGNLYGILRDANGQMRYIGIWEEQIAEFPAARENEAWHGYPIWPLKGLAPPSLRGDRCRPEKQVFTRMLDAGLITKRERKRLSKEITFDVTGQQHRGNSPPRF